MQLQRALNYKYTLPADKLTLPKNVIGQLESNMQYKYRELKPNGKTGKYIKNPFIPELKLKDINDTDIKNLNLDYDTGKIKKFLKNKEFHPYLNENKDQFLSNIKNKIKDSIIQQVEKTKQELITLNNNKEELKNINERIKILTKDKKQIFNNNNLSDDQKKNQATNIDNLLKIQRVNKETYNKTNNVDLNFDLMNLGDNVKLLRNTLKNTNLVLQINGKYVTLNEKNFQKFIKEDYMDDQNDNTGMDSWEQLQREATKKITTSKVFNTAYKSRPSGAFFKYYNLTTFNFERYGIYQDIKEKYNEYCLIYALEKGGLSYLKIEKLKSFVKHSNIPKIKLNEICEELDITIRLKTFKNEGTHDTNISYGNNNNEIFNIGLVDEHYFINEPINMTTYSLSHYNEIKDLKDFKHIYEKKNRTQYRKKFDNYIDSFEVVCLLLKHKDTLLKPIDYDHLFETTMYNKLNNTDIKTLDYSVQKDREDYRLIPDVVFNYLTNSDYFTVTNKGKYSRLSRKNSEGICDDEIIKYKRIAYDIETYTNEDQIHTPYMLCMKTLTNEYDILINKDPKYNLNNKPRNYEKIRSKEKTYIGENCVYDFLYNIEEDCILYAHNNCNYDYTFLKKYLFNIKETILGNSVMRSEAMFVNRDKKVIKIILKDTYLLTQCKLEDFKENFLSVEDQKLYQKEVMPYDIYNKENLDKRWLNLNDILKSKDLLKNKDKINQFIDNVKRLNLINENNEVDIIAYSEFYCKMDVELLINGYESFRKMIEDVTSLNCDGIISLASLAHKYLVTCGCYNEVYEISGNLRAFIQLCCVGGRTMTNNNSMYNIEELLNDLDGVSLYPSSMYRIPGFLKGLPEIINNERNENNYEFLSKQDGYFVEIKIKKIGKKLQFPLQSKINKKGVRIFTNKLKNKIIYVDKTSLEDLIKFQHAEFEIIRGYYFKDGFNKTINNVIYELFNLRKEYKKNKSKVQLIYKLIMNCSYGKTLLKAPEFKIEYIEQDKIDKYVSYNYNYIEEYVEIPNELNDTKKYRVKSRQTIGKHFNIAHVGVTILSMSKRIMNEVMCLAEDLKIFISYQDTDSMHIEDNKINYLAKKFKELYGRDLIGENLGQFHCDFDVSHMNTMEQINKFDVKLIKDPVSYKSIFLGKKSYIDCVCDRKDKDRKNILYHIRMKSIPNDVIMKYCGDAKYTPFDLYQQLYDYEVIKFDLLSTKPRFKKNNNSTIESVTEFYRTCRFD